MDYCTEVAVALVLLVLLAVRYKVVTVGDQVAAISDQGAEVDV